MRFLHAADLHLGLRVTRFGADTNGRVQEARMKGLEVLIDRAKTHEVEFVLIAGDLFDDNKVDAATSRRAYEMLESANCPVYIIPGNHDPITADSVFRRPPWVHANGVLRVLQTREPCAIPGGTLWPCPLQAKNSAEDPTHWIPPRGAGDTSIRIGLAHGSLKDRDNLPADDHLIDRHCVDAKGLDYLALGHWHRLSQYPDRAGVVRTVYPGMHEPNGFFQCPEYSTGWCAYTNTVRHDLFADDGKGRVALVTLDGPQAPPRIEEVEIGRLDWRDETVTLRDEAGLSALIDDLGRRPHQERQLLRLHLQGTLSAQALARLDELDQTRSGGQGGVLSRYFWAELDVAQLFAEPTEAELQALATGGIVRAVYDRLRAETLDGDSQSREVAHQALLLLYQYAREAEA